MTMKIGLTGANGQMGETLNETVKNSDHEISFRCDKCEKASGNIKDESRIGYLLSEFKTDVVIDFTAPQPSIRYCEAAAETNTPIVIGTTGFSDDQITRLKSLSSETPVLKASNFSKSIAVMKELVRNVCSSLKNYDVEITETHHNKKKDSPSGTAKDLKDAVKESKTVQSTENGREGHQPRKQNEVGMHSRRAGDIRGVHEVMLAGNDEVLKISHRSESRKVFSSGALEAAEWLVERENGFYQLRDTI